MNSENILQIIKEQAKTNSFSGVIQIRLNDNIIHEQGYGFAHRPEATPNTINTRFATASGTKAFTAIAICQLIERGKLSFDTPLTEYAQLIPIVSDYDPHVTIHHLLSHSSGIPDYIDEETMSDEDYTALYAKFPVYTLRRPADYLPMFPEAEMNFKPGDSFRYCNGAYILLALLIEHLTGMTYQHYVEENILKPAGMADSGFFEMDSLPEHTALGYIHDEEGDFWRSNIFSLPIIGCGDGGAYVTAPDMLKFWDSLLRHDLLDKEMTRKLLSPHVIAGNPEDHRHYAYGLWVSTTDDGSIFRYSAVGGDLGVNFISALFPQHNTLLTIIGNTEGPTWSIFGKIFEEITA